MKKLIPALTGLLALQLALFAMLASRDEPTSTFAPTESLLGSDLSNIDKIVVEEKDQKQIELVKKDEQWLLPASFDFPADGTKVRDFIKTLGEFKKSWPVGNTTIAAKQFNVVDDKFERRITFFAADSKVKTLYLGSSPSFRKINARVDNDKETYSVKFNAYEAPTDGKEWIDKKYLALDRSKVKEVQLGQVVLENKAGDFLVKDSPADKETITAKAASLATKAIAGEFDEVLGRKDSVAVGAKVHGVTVLSDGDERVEFLYFKPQQSSEPLSVAANTPPKPEDKKEDDYLVLTTSKHPYAFKVRKAKVDELAAATSTTLLKDKQKEEASPASPSNEATQGQLTPGGQGDHSESSSEDTSDAEDALAKIEAP